MIMTYEQFLNRLAERTYDNTRQLKRVIEQRRNGMEDLYGVEFTHNGDAEHPATFYVSVSPDLVYYERFALKLIIEPFSSSVAGVSGGGEMTIGDTSLAFNGSGGGQYIISGTSTLDENSESGSLTPNPHTHTVSGSIGGLSYGIKKISTSSAVWRVEIDGIDITDYLIEQHDGEWIHGEGIYPTNRLEDREDFYDILDVASMMTAEGEIESRNKILAPTFKKVQVYSDAPFGLTAFLYLKYSHTNR